MTADTNSGRELFRLAAMETSRLLPSPFRQKKFRPIPAYAGAA